MMTCLKKTSFCRGLSHQAVIVATVLLIVTSGASEQMQSHDHATVVVP